MHAEVDNSAMHKRHTDNFTTAYGEEVLYVLLLCATIWAIGLPGHLLTHRVPSWDAAQFMINAQQIVAAFDNGWVSGLRGLYLIRGWRPIIFPAVASPFLALTEGNIVLAVGLTQLFSLSLIGVYAFSLMRQFLSARRAFIGALFVVTTAWLFTFSYSFYSEAFWMGAILGWACHFLAGRARNSPAHLLVSGLWLGLAGATRPAETVLITLLPLGLGIGRAIVWRKVSYFDALFFLLQGGAVVIAVWQRVQVSYTDGFVLGLLGLSLVLVAVRARRFFGEASIFGVAIFAEFIYLVWYLPVLPELYAWAYETSFGQMAKMSAWARFADLSPATLWAWFAEAYTPKTLGYVIIIGLAGLIAPWGGLPDRKAVRGALRVISLSILMFVPVFAILLISGTSDWRRSMPEVLTFYVGAVGLALVPNGRLPRARLAGVVLLVLIQTVAAGANGMNLRWATPAALVNWIGYYHRPLTVEDGNVAFIAELSKAGFTRGHFAAYTICYRDGLVGCTRRGIPWFETEAATAVALEQHLDMSIGAARDLDFSKLDTLAAQLKQRGFNLLVVDTLYEPDRVISTDPLESLQHSFEQTARFIGMVQNGLPPGFKEVGKFTFGERDVYVSAIE